jgi:uncharacterized membrane protein HdeD (DUF308 family)
MAAIDVRAYRALGPAWWLVLAQGAAAALAGLLVIAQPGDDNLLTLLAVLGLLWLASGVLELATLTRDHARWPSRLLCAGAQLWAAMTALRQPLWSTLLVPATLVGTLGTLAVVIGLLQLLRALRSGRRGTAALGVLHLLLGLILLLCPLPALVPVAALWTILGGAGVMAFGLRLRPERSQAEAL